MLIILLLVIICPAPLSPSFLHELIHTVPGGLCHTGQWRKWAKDVSGRTDYGIHCMTDPKHMKQNG